MFFVFWNKNVFSMAFLQLMYTKNSPDSCYNHLSEGKHCNSFTEILVPPLEHQITCHAFPLALKQHQLPDEQLDWGHHIHTECRQQTFKPSTAFSKNYFIFQISLKCMSRNSVHLSLHFLWKFLFVDLLKGPV